MSRSQPVRRRSLALVALLVACLLRSLVPQLVPAQPGEGPREARVAHAVADYPCAGHACCCRTRAQCLDRCCCFDAPAPARAARPDGSEPVASEPVATRTTPANGERRVDVLEALRCGGGRPLPAAAPSGAWFAVLPAEISASAPPTVRARWTESLRSLRIADLREPPAPPPRGSLPIA